MTFLYIITGQREKLVKLGRIFKVRGEASSLVEVGLVTRDGDVIADSLALAGYTDLAGLARTNIKSGVKSFSQFRPSSSNWPESPRDLGGVKESELRLERHREDVRESLVNICDK